MGPADRGSEATWGLSAIDINATPGLEVLGQPAMTVFVYTSRTLASGELKSRGRKANYT